MGDFLSVGGAVVEGFDLGVDPGFAGGGLAEAAAEVVFFVGGEADAVFVMGFWGCGGAGHIGASGRTRPAGGAAKQDWEVGAVPNIYLTRYIVIVQYCKGKTAGLDDFYKSLFIKTLCDCAVFGAAIVGGAEVVAIIATDYAPVTKNKATS